MLVLWVVRLLFLWVIILKNKILLVIISIFVFSSCLFLGDKKSTEYFYKFVIGKKVRYKSNISIKYRVGSYGLGRTGSVTLSFNTEILNRGNKNGINRLYLTSRNFRIGKRKGSVRFLIRYALKYLRKKTVLYMDNKGLLKKINYGYHNYIASSYEKLFSYFIFPNLHAIKQLEPNDSLEFPFDKYLFKLSGTTKFLDNPDSLSWGRRITLLIEENGKRPIDVKLDIHQVYSKIYSLPLKISNAIYFKMPITIKTGFINLTTEANVIIEFSMNKIDE